MSKQAVLERRRSERIARERAVQQREARTRRLWRLGAVAAAAVVLVTAAIAVSSSGGEKPAPPATVSTQLAGIPESHGVLGDPDAPVTVTEYLDLQCPVCAEAAQSTLPALIEEVRAGNIKLDVRTMHFLGEDSVRAARVAAGAERQGRLWAFLEAFYARQGTENSGYVTDDFLREVSEAAGVDASKAFAQEDTTFATGRLERANADAARMNVQGTPTLTVKSEGGAERTMKASPLDAQAVQAELAALR
jgi:protein-disulfide isomerase